MTTIERTVTLATIAETLPDAWVFVMAHIDDVGDDPRVTINPMWVVFDDGDDVRKFEVSVSGMVETE